MSASKLVLVVDDDQNNREILRMLITGLGHRPDAACSGEEALEKLKMGPDLVLMDVMMPGMDGFETTRKIREDPDFGDVPIIMVTALTSREDRLRAVEAGANDFVTKPVDRVELRIRSASLLKMKEAQDTIKRHRCELEATVERRTAALKQALEDMAEARRRTQQAHLDTIFRLALASEFKDGDTGAHIQRIGDVAALLAESLGMDSRDVKILRYACPMHDVGKIGVPESILGKPGKLSVEEWDIMKQHTVVGARLLEGSPSEFLQVGEVIARSHHEKWDGTGYPEGLAADNIPIWGRICAIADVFDALTSDRPYREAIPSHEALDTIKAGRGSHFDPQLVDLFVDKFDDILRIQEKYRNVE